MSTHSVQVRVDPDLRFLLPARHRGGTVTVPVDGNATIGHVAESLGLPRTEIGELLVAGTTAPASARANPGDVIEVRPVARPQPVDAPRFVLDVHFGTLARRMRLLGIDTAYRNDADDPELVVQANAENRVLLTQDRGLLRRRALSQGAYVRGGSTGEQLADVLSRFAPPLAPWTRCPACTGELKPAAKDEIEHLLQPGTQAAFTEFSRCAGCGRPYWRGAHAGKLDEFVAGVLAGRLPAPGPLSKRVNSDRQ